MTSRPAVISYNQPTKWMAPGGSQRHPEGKDSCWAGPPPYSPPPVGWVTSNCRDHCNQTPVITQIPALCCVHSLINAPKCHTESSCVSPSWMGKQVEAQYLA